MREGQPGGKGHPCHHSVSQGDSDVRTPGVLMITLIPGAQVVSIPERPWECAFEPKSPSGLSGTCCENEGSGGLQVWDQVQGGVPAAAP